MPSTPRKDFSYDCRACGARVPERENTKRKLKGLHRFEPWCPACGMHHTKDLKPVPRGRHTWQDPFPEPKDLFMQPDDDGRVAGIVAEKVREKGIAKGGNKAKRPARTVRVLTALARGGTQLEAAKATGVPKQTVSDIAKSNRDLLEEIHDEIQIQLTAVGIAEGVEVAKSMADIAKDRDHRNAPNAAKVFFEATSGVGRRPTNLHIGNQYTTHSITVEGDAQIANISDAALDERMRKLQEELGL